MSTILIVDDATSFRDPIAMMLRQRGHHPLCASHGQEALTILEGQTPDLILLDMCMPVMDGPTFLCRMRAVPQWKDIPVIMLTANDRPTSCVQEGDEYMVKTQFTLQHLMVRIDQRLKAA